MHRLADQLDDTRAATLLRRGGVENGDLGGLDLHRVGEDHARQPVVPGGGSGGWVVDGQGGAKGRACQRLLCACMCV